MADTTAVATSDQQGALDIVNEFLHQYGLDSLADWAWGEIVADKSASQVSLDLYNQPAFKQRFPAIDERQKAGLPPISPIQYIQYEDSARQIMQAAGFPPSFYDQPEDFHDLIAKDVSVSELSQRAQLYTQAAYQTPVETRGELQRLYGVGAGGIAAYFADENRALPLLQAQFSSAQIAGQAQVQGFGQLDKGEAQRLQSLGVTDQQASQGFGNVAQLNQLFQTLPGESKSVANRATALGVVAGNALDQQTMQTEAAKRKAQFGAGGGYVAGQTGTSGLSSAQT